MVDSMTEKQHNLILGSDLNVWKFQLWVRAECSNKSVSMFSLQRSINVLNQKSTRVFLRVVFI